MNEITTSFTKLDLQRTDEEDPNILYPPIISASKGTNTDYILLSWSLASGATGYDLYRSATNNSSSATKIGSASSTLTSIEDEDVEQGKTYYYWIKAKSNSSGSYVYSEFSDSDFGSLKAVVVENHPPDKPILISPANLSSVSVPYQLSWQCNDPDQDYLTYTYWIRRSGEGYEGEKDYTKTFVDINTDSNKSLPGTYQWYVIASDGEFETESDVWEYTIPNNSPNQDNVALSTNVGLGSAISEGIYNGIKHYAYMANDNDRATAWCSQWSMPAWLKIKFDKEYSINKVGVVWGNGGHNHEFEISLSTDDINWTTVVPSRNSNTNAGYTNSQYHGTDEVQESFSINSTSARYIKIDITSTSAPSSHIFQAIVHELQAFTSETQIAVWSNNFEAYPSGTFPNDWTSDANANNLITNYIDNTTSSEGSQSLKLFGQLNACWGALAYYQLDVIPPYEIELNIRNGNESLTGCHPDRACVGLRSGTSWSNPSRGFIRFDGDGSIVVNGTEIIGNYDSGKWYKIKIGYNPTLNNQVKLSYWIDDVFKTELIVTKQDFENDLNYLDLTVQEGSAWFDDIKIYKPIATVIENTFEDNEFNIYPNPFDSRVFIECIDKPSLDFIIRVFDTYGKLLINKELSGSINTINTSHLPHGIYFIQIEIDSKVICKKLVK